MSRTSSLFLSLAILAIFAPSLQAEVHWHSNPRGAQLQAKQSGMPILIYVGTSSCGHCVRMDQTTWSNPQISQLANGRYVPLKIDGNQWRTLANRLQAHSYPTVVVLTPEGQLISRSSGYQSASGMNGFLTRHGRAFSRQTTQTTTAATAAATSEPAS